MSRVRHYAVRHETVYEYQGEVAHAHQLLHLAPRPCPYQTALTHKIELEPAPGARWEEVDSFGNPVTRLEFDRPYRELKVIAKTEVEVTARPAQSVDESEEWEQVRDWLAYHPWETASDRLEACRFRTQSPYVRIKKAFAEYAEASFQPGRPILAAAIALGAQIHQQFTYALGKTTVGTPLLEVLELRRGVCQDFSHVMIACLRSIGLAARYVSGYVKTALPDHAAMVGGDASHAWVQVFCPPFGWIDLDPTNGVRVDSEHVTLGWGRDFGDVSPLRGVIIGGGEHSIRVAVVTREIHADATQ